MNIPLYDNILVRIKYLVGDNEQENVCMGNMWYANESEAMR